MSETSPTIGDLLRRLRQEQGLTMEALATRMGHARSYVWQYEHNRGRPRARSLRRIARALGSEERMLILLLLETVGAEARGDWQRAAEWWRIVAEWAKEKEMSAKAQDPDR